MPKENNIIGGRNLNEHRFPSTACSDILTAYKPESRPTAIASLSYKILCLSFTTLFFYAINQPDANAQQKAETKLDKGHESRLDADVSDPSKTAPPLDSEKLSLTKDCSKWFGPSITLYHQAHKQMYDGKYAAAILQLSSALSQNQHEMRQDAHLTKVETLLKWGLLQTHPGPHL